MNAATTLPPSTEQPRQTSLEAYYRLRDTGALSSIRWAVYDALFHHGPMTRNELDAKLRGENAINASYSRRLTELEDMGLAYRALTRPCRFSGRSCEAWDVTNVSTPRPMVRAPSKLELAHSQLADLYELCEGVAAWLDDKNKQAAERIRSRVAEIRTVAP